MYERRKKLSRAGGEARKVQQSSIHGWMAGKVRQVAIVAGGCCFPLHSFPLYLTLAPPTQVQPAPRSCLVITSSILSPNLYYSPLAHRSLTVLIDRIKHLVIVIVLRILIILLALTYHWHCYCYPLLGSHRLVSVIAVASSMSLGSPLLLS
jgi:hypothetical protein